VHRMTDFSKIPIILYIDSNFHKSISKATEA